MKIRIAILISALLLSLVGCTAAPTATEPATEPVVTNPVEEGLVLATPVGQLTCPSEWASYVRLEQGLEDGLYRADLYGITGEHETLLFTVYVGEQGDGHLFGTAPDDQGQRLAIWVSVEEFQGDETYVEEELQVIWQMQQNVNVLIDQIYELPGFEE